MKKIIITMSGLVILAGCKTQKTSGTATKSKTYSIRKDKDQDGIQGKDKEGYITEFIELTEKYKTSK
ncbi:hypothetical protein [Chryseobacterium arthrosphaerae]|uniref:hypothetical protein n=1 Tax=Chryseobacterium arthrosphaerae TaxID=651561 RepID=UPI001E6278B3|nr:hypothetical protein [Chryseobacterium arthrosphaerae]UEQ78279.1 hypothetical protein J8N07_08290 [Chryseobacterium arthrosphaerae]